MKTLALVSVRGLLCVQWEIPNWFSLPRDEIYTEVLPLAGYEWCVGRGPCGCQVLRGAAGDRARWRTAEPAPAALAPICCCSRLGVFPKGAPTGNGGSPAHLGLCLQFSDRGEGNSACRCLRFWKLESFSRGCILSLMSLFSGADVTKFQEGFHADVQISIVNRRNAADTITKCEGPPARGGRAHGAFGRLVWTPPAPP